mmetsp:Transcript_7837/g.24604  ORF Transcript_7837/g.24604 Transcript_7837/m.24604 type:complete len:213 (-) Transcript_7837:78-716(-)
MCNVKLSLNRLVTTHRAGLAACANAFPLGAKTFAGTRTRYLRPFFAKLCNWSFSRVVISSRWTFTSFKRNFVPDALLLFSLLFTLLLLFSKTIVPEIVPTFTNSSSLPSSFVFSLLMKYSSECQRGNCISSPCFLFDARSSNALEEEEDETFVSSFSFEEDKDPPIFRETLNDFTERSSSSPKPSSCEEEAETKITSTDAQQRMIETMTPMM